MLYFIPSACRARCWCCARAGERRVAVFAPVDRLLILDDSTGNRSAIGRGGGGGGGARCAGGREVVVHILIPHEFGGRGAALEGGEEVREEGLEVPSVVVFRAGNRTRGKGSGGRQEI